MNENGFFGENTGDLSTEEQVKDHYWNRLLNERLALYLQKNAIEHEVLKSFSEAEFEQQWITHFVPAEKRELAARYCRNNNSSGTQFLWHAFTYNIVQGAEKDEAKRRLRSADKKDCILWLSLPGIAFNIHDAEKLTPEVLAEFSEANLTKQDFSWTYLQDHEDIGPFFYAPETS